jgi:TRAP-type uncharacterized transport system substrate-binding protein
MRRIVSVTAAIAFVIGALSGITPAAAQNVPKSLEEGGADASLKARKNTWTVGIVGGLISGTYMRFADELAKALDDGDDLRVLPIVSYGAASNMDDLLYLRGVDVAVTQSDVFEYFRNERKTANLDKRVNYILRLPASEVHILARAEYGSLEDLKGKKVSFGPAGAGSSLTGAVIFQRLGIKVEALNINEAEGLRRLRAGEIAAMIRVIGKPVDVLAKLPADSGLRFLPVPYSKAFADYYVLGELNHEDYPTLIPQGQRVDTLGVPTVLAVFNWTKGGDRHRRVERFVERMFANWDKFQKPPFHPKWREVNLAATVPGWTRYFAAEEMLQRMTKPVPAATEREGLNRDFLAFMDSAAGRIKPRTEAERELFFREFMTWREKQGAKSR